MDDILILFPAAAKSLQSCPTLCNPIDGSPPVSPIPGILQARTLEWVAISFSNHESEKWKWSRSVVSNSSRPHGLQPTRLLRPWDFPGKSTGVGCHCLLLSCFLSSTNECMYIYIFFPIIYKNDGTYKSAQTLYSAWLPHVNNSICMWDDWPAL